VAQIGTISKAEATKQQSRQLRGHLARDLADTATPFDGEGYSLLKFHGIYQGYDRDSATERKQRGDEKLWQFMVRVRIPGGRLTAQQYLALDDLADRYANGSLRVTTRQSIQFHGVVKRGLKKTVAEVMTSNVMVTTSGNFSPPALRCTIDILGIDRVMFSVDWPYESNKLGVAFLNNLGLPQADLEKLAHGNAERLLSL